jgi:multisubunit Na+/H+ antiporter MnhB subunit
MIDAEVGRMGNRQGKRNFHESYSAGAVKPPSARSTGLVFTGVAVLIAIAYRHSPNIWPIAAGVAVILLALSYLAPRVLEPLNIVWFKIGMLMHRVVNPAIMFLMFAIAVVPMGALMRLFSDPLRLKRDPKLSTYWLEPDPAELKLSSMKNQF